MYFGFNIIYCFTVKPQTNTNGPMLGQTEPGVNRDIIIADSRKDNVHEKVCYLW